MVCFALIVCVCAGLLLTGCQQEKDFDTAADKVIHPAMKLFDFFYRYCLPVDEDSAETVGDAVYYLVDFDRYPTYQAFQDAVYAAFSREIGDSLFALGHYREIDGRFVADGFDHEDRVNQAISNVSFLLSEEKKTVIHYKALVTFSETGGNFSDMKEFFYDYKLVDGQWLFTRFDYFWVDITA